MDPSVVVGEETSVFVEAAKEIERLGELLRIEREENVGLAIDLKETQRERDEARRRICEDALRMGRVFRRVEGRNVECLHAKDVAGMMGWTCFDEGRADAPRRKDAEAEATVSRLVEEVAHWRRKYCREACKHVISSGVRWRTRPNPMRSDMVFVEEDCEPGRNLTWFAFPLGFAPEDADYVVSFLNGIVEKDDDLPPEDGVP